jgi:signal transduction histidine kinase
MVGLGLAAAFGAGWLTRGRRRCACNHEQHERLEKMQDSFIATVSHELRTPLTSLNGSLSLLSAGLLQQQPERAARMLQIAAANADRLAKLVEDVLDAERMASGSLALNLEPCHASEVAKQAIALVREKAERRRVRIEVQEPSGPSLMGHADKERLVQALRNVLDNAVKFSVPGGLVSVRIEAGPKDVRFSVHDQGEGIASDQLETIFDRFQRLDNSDARRTGGTGLGLAISKSIVEAHGGLISAASDGPGTGATVSFTLPL